MLVGTQIKGKNKPSHAHAHTVPSPTPSATQSTPSTCESCRAHTCTHISDKSINDCESFLQVPGARRAAASVLRLLAVARQIGKQPERIRSRTQCAGAADICSIQCSHGTVVSHHRYMQETLHFGCASREQVRWVRQTPPLQCGVWCDPHNSEPQALHTRLTRRCLSWRAGERNLQLLEALAHKPRTRLKRLSAPAAASQDGQAVAKRQGCAHTHNAASQSSVRHTL